jgi:hypothetical protein
LDDRLGVDGSQVRVDVVEVGASTGGAEIDA